MNATMKRLDDPLAIDKRMLKALQEIGPQTLEGLCSRAGVAWVQGFLAIDRLSRSGAVSLRQATRCEYQVSINRAAA